MRDKFKEFSSTAKDGLDAATNAANSIMGALKIPFKIFRIIKWSLYGLCAFTVVWFAIQIASLFGGNAQASHPLAAFFYMMTAAIFAGLAFYIYRNSFAQKTSIEKKPKAMPAVIEISYSEIRQSKPVDKWVVAEIRGAINASVKESRKGLNKLLKPILGDIECSLSTPAHVIYNYYIPMSDNRFSAKFDTRTQILEIRVPPLKFDSSDRICIENLSEIDTEISKFVPQKQKVEIAQKVREFVQQNYALNGASEVNLRLAREDAKKTILKSVENLLWTHNGTVLSAASVPRIEWLDNITKELPTPEPQRILDTHSDIEILPPEN